MSSNPIIILQIQPKKTWQDPELFLISTNQVGATKHHPSVHEGTGHTLVTLFGSKLFVNPSNVGFTLTNSVGGVVGHKSSAAS